MKTKFLFTLTLVAYAAGVLAQNELNNYKYVIVPNKFEFQKEENAYNLNKLSQFLFNKYGFTALIEGKDYPSDLTNNGCLGLQSNVVKEPGMFKTKLKVVLKDCGGTVIYTSQIGESREKEYYVAYNKAIREAFKSFEMLNYSYAPSIAESSKPKMEQKDKTEEIEQLKKEIKALKEVKENKEQEFQELKTAEKKSMEKKSEAIELPKPAQKTNANASNILYAQAINDGFQVVDSTPKIVMILMASSLEDVFIVKDKNAIVFKKDGDWFYSSNSEAPQKLNLKF
ncbi:MAG: hypothetical protein ACON5F_00790 [Jejuia sp.]